MVLWDAAAWLVALSIATVLRYEGYDIPWGAALTLGLLGAVSLALLMALQRLYDGRHAVGSLDEGVLVVATCGLNGMLWTVPLAFLSPRPLAMSVPLVSAALTSILMVAGRVLYRKRHENRRPHSMRTRALVVGAGDAGRRVVRDLLVDGNAPYDPIAFVDDGEHKRHFRVGSVRVEGRVEDLARLVEDRDIEVVLVAAPSAGPSLIERVSAEADAVRVKVKSLPTLSELAGASVGFRDLRDLELADFLGRPEVRTDTNALAHLIEGKRVLVTGAGGSIGSELCRSISRLGPRELFALDRDESALLATQLSLDDPGTYTSVLADIRDSEALENLFTEHRPQVVFHAAALKHLNMLERYPEEALKTNVVGTQNVLAAAQASGVGVFVNISTDKAADPSSVLGESKRLAEQLTAYAAQQTEAVYVSVRFGNVLGSRGSVLTVFEEQIRQNRPLTITHPEATRYFMLIPEAVQLVLQAAAIGRDGQVMVLDMGEPVRIGDVAQRLIQLSGKPLTTVITGLKPGEKLHEVLQSCTEDLQPTPHPSISACSVPPIEPRSLSHISVSKEGRLAITLPQQQTASQRI